MAPAGKNKSKSEKKIKSGKAPGRLSGVSYDDLWSRPGFLVRRLHQIHIGLFAEECQAFDMTPIQYGLLTVLSNGTALDQVTLSTEVGIDRTSGADVIRRLERRGLLSRISSQQDRRAKLVKITQSGMDVVQKMHSAMERTQQRLVEPLDSDEREEFQHLMQKIILVNNSASRAPMPKGFITPPTLVKE